MPSSSRMRRTRTAGNGRGAHDGLPEARQVVLVASGMVEQRREHGRRPRHVRDPLALDQLEHRVGLEHRDREGDRPLHEPDHPSRLVPEAVEERRRDDVPVVLLQVEGLAEDLVAAQAGTVPEHHALRRSRRARGEDDVAHVVGVAGVDDRAGPLEGDGIAEGEELLPARARSTRRGAGDPRCARGRAGPVRRRGARRRSRCRGTRAGVKRRRASVLSRMNAASSPFRRVLSGTSQAPAARTPNPAAIHAAEFGAHTATRSPGSTPAAIRLRATAIIRCSTSTNVHRVSPSTTASRSPKRAALARTIRGIVP